MPTQAPAAERLQLEPDELKLVKALGFEHLLQHTGYDTGGSRYVAYLPLQAAQGRRACVVPYAPIPHQRA